MSNCQQVFWIATGRHLAHHGRLLVAPRPQLLVSLKVACNTLDLILICFPAAQVSVPLVNAYMARRALDYLVGFNVSPLLWRKLPGARSAGTAQCEDARNGARGIVG